MSFLIAGAAIGAVGAGINVVNGIEQKNAANRLAKNNIRPMYTIPSQYYQDDDIAASQAENGLPESTLNFYSTQANRGLSGGIDATLEGGGDVNNLSKLYDQFSQGISAEAAQDAQMKEGHINTFINANKDLAGQKTQQWALNYYDPYKDTAQLASAEKAAGNNSISTGIGEAVGTASTLSNDELYKSANPVQTFGQKTGAPTLSLSAPSLNIPSSSPTGGAPDTIPAYHIPGSDSFGTEGGSAFLNDIGGANANSPELQRLISILNRAA